MTALVCDFFSSFFSREAFGGWMKKRDPVTHGREKKGHCFGKQNRPMSNNPKRQFVSFCDRGLSFWRYKNTPFPPMRQIGVVNTFREMGRCIPK